MEGFSPSDARRVTYRPFSGAEELRSAAQLAPNDLLLQLHKFTFSTPGLIVLASNSGILVRQDGGVVSC